MKTLKQFLLESAPTDKDKTNFDADMLFVAKWYVGDFSSGHNFPAGKTIDAFKRASSYIKKFASIDMSAPSTIYRTFPVTDFAKLLDKTQGDEIIGMLDTSNPKDIMDALNKILDGKSVSLDTGIKPIQSWTETRKVAQGFHNQFYSDSRNFSVVAKTSISSSEVIGYWKNFQKYLSGTYGMLDALFKTSTEWNYHLLSNFENWVNGGAAWEKEVTVDVSLPRQVTITDVFVPPYKDAVIRDIKK